MNNFIECYPTSIPCDSVINYFNTDYRRVNGKLGGRVDHALKHSTDIRCKFNEPLYQQYNELIHKQVVGGLQLYVGKYEFLMEISSWRIYNGYNLQYYGEGEGYHALHCEHEMETPAQYRILAWMIYLNDAQCGTCYPYQDIITIPKAGDLWIWPAFWTHAHRGETPNKGDKYIATGWCEFER